MASPTGAQPQGAQMVVFKIRNKKTGMFYQNGWSWNETGKSYKTLAAAKGVLGRYLMDHGMRRAGPEGEDALKIMDEVTNDVELVQIESKPIITRTFPTVDVTIHVQEKKRKEVIENLKYLAETFVKKFDSASEAPYHEVYDLQQAYKQAAQFTEGLDTLRAFHGLPTLEEVDKCLAKREELRKKVTWQEIFSYTHSDSMYASLNQLEEILAQRV